MGVQSKEEMIQIRMYQEKLGAIAKLSRNTTLPEPLWKMLLVKEATLEIEIDLRGPCLKQYYGCRRRQIWKRMEILRSRAMVLLLLFSSRIAFVAAVAFSMRPDV